MLGGESHRVLEKFLSLWKDADLGIEEGCAEEAGWIEGILARKY